MKLIDILQSNNLAEELDEETLNSISDDLMTGYRLDESSRAEWVERTEDYIRLATQVTEEKNFPWPNSSNVKYPLLTTAAIQFSARSYPALVQGNNPIKVVSLGYDPMGEKMKQADRMSKHMSYQLLYEMTEWEQDMDRLLMTLPIVGTAFKKTYFCPLKGRNVSEYVSPLDLVINYHAKSVEDANRKFHKLTYYENSIIEKIRSGEWIDIDINAESPTIKTREMDTETQRLTPVVSDEDAPFDVVEAHCFLDLDEDGYKEPYVVTLMGESEKIVRIVPRFTEDGIEWNDKQEVKKIIPTEFFTGYIFIPDPASNVYGLGFGHLLGPLNDTTNTIINQLIDAGTLAVTGGGFLGRGFKLRNMGDIRFKPGEWKMTQSTGDDLRKNIFPLPVREPSGTLFNLLGTLIDAGQKLSSTMDIMLGESPGQNQPATTTMAVMEQGLKVFTSIHKRVYRSLKSELNKLFKLNAQYLNPQEYFRVLDIQQETPQSPQQMQGMNPQSPQQPMPPMPQNNNMVVYLADYQKNIETADVAPAGDPNVVTQAQKLVKAEALLSLMASGVPLNQQEVIRRVLEAQEQPDIQTLMNVPPQGPPPEVQLEIDKFEWQKQKEQEELRLDQDRISAEAVKDEGQAINQLVKAQTQIRESGLNEMQQEIEAAKEAIAAARETSPIGGMTNGNQPRVGPA